MNQTLFIRLLHYENKEKVLADKISSLREGHQDKDIYTVSPNSFCNVPNTPFCYWVSDRIRRLFTELSPFESNGRTAQQGASTKDDFRFLRAWWEVPARRILDAANGPDRHDDLTYFKEWCKNRTFQGKRWVMFAKGGGYKPFYADVHLVVNWEKDANELEMFLLKRYPYLGHSANWVLHRESYYFLPGLTWTKRAGRFNPWPLPAGCIFSERAYTAFVPDSEILSTYSILNSKVWDFLFRTMLGRFGHPEFLVGISKKLPWPLKLPFKIDIASKALKSVMESLSSKEHTLLFRCLSLQNNHDTISVLDLYQDFDRIGYEAYGVENVDEVIIEEVYAERFMEEQIYEDKIKGVDNDLLN